MYNRLVRNKRLLLSLPLLLAASLFVPSHVVPSAHAQLTGLVCITDSTTATSCPSSPAAIGPLTPGSTFSVGVFIQGSDAMGGFDIFVASNPAFVSPVSAALGSLVVTPSLTSICINGSAQTGSCTVGSANGAGVVEVTTIESSGSNECGGLSPCSGMAFTITYHVVGATPTTSLSYPTAAGCSNSSVASPPNTCVLVSDNLGTTLPENIQGATVTIVQAQFTGLVCITASASATSCPASPPSLGPFTVGQTFTVGVFVQGSNAMGGFDIFVSVNAAYLIPTNAALGNLIANPSVTTRCVNEQSFEGACTVNEANGPGVVEVSTIESTGLNECGNVGPCSGMAFTITYRVVGNTPSTSFSFPSAPACFNTSVSSPADVCVLVDSEPDDVTCPENLQGAMVTQTLASTRVSKFFTDSSLNPLPLDNNGNPMVNVVLGRSIVESTNPGQVLAWVNVSNTGSTSLQSLKLTYGLIKTSQSFASYPRNYADTASAAAWTLPSFTGTESSGSGSAFFIAYAKVVGDPGGDTPIIDVSKYAIV